MSLDPANFRTWTAFEDHPIFGPDKSKIQSWSNDASQYSDLDSYGRFLPGYYVHIDPAPSVDVQQRTARRDIENLASACDQIEKTFGAICYELVVLDDLTVFVWIRHKQFSVEVYPCFPDEDAILRMFVDMPNGDELEIDGLSVPILVDKLCQSLGDKPTNERKPE